MNDEVKPISLLLAHQRPLTRAGIRTLLEGAEEIEIVGEANDAMEIQRLAARLRPQVLLLDIHFSEYPTDSIARVRAHSPETAILILFDRDEDSDLALVIGAGVAGFVDKRETPEQMVAAIRRAANGEVLLSREQLAAAERWQRERAERWGNLTRREHEVLELIVAGKSNKQIGEALTISEHTVETHVGHLLSKLAVASRTEAIVWVWRHGLMNTTDLPEE